MGIGARRSESKHRKIDETLPSCPSCGSRHVFRDGVRRTKNIQIQRYICRDCGLRFSDQSAKDPAEPQEHPETNSAELPNPENVADDNISLEEGDYALHLSKDVCLNESDDGYQGVINPRSHFSKRLVCAEEAKNLAAIDEIRNVVAGEISESKSLLLQFALYQKKQGYAESTIITRGVLLGVLNKRGADIKDPESVKETIAEQIWEPKRKQNAVDAYSRFLDMLGETWDPPTYKPVPKIPFIPTEDEIDILINESGRKISAFLLLLKETAIRAGEGHKLKWTDIDFERRVIRITPEKGSRPRIFNVSEKLMSKLAAIKNFNKGIDANRVFSKLLRTIRRLFIAKRKRLAALYNNPRLNQIHFHTLRHWKATMLYHQTKDLLYVQRFLGHRSIANTMLYIQIEEALFGAETDQYICKVARTVEEAIPLLEDGFTEASDFNGVKIYRKPKSMVTVRS